LIPAKIEDYALRYSSAETPLLKALAEETRRETELPQMMVGPVEGAFLAALVRVSRAKRVLEIGTFTGYSALWMAGALPSGGRLITCDVDPVSTAIAKKYWAKSPAGRKIELRLGPALDTLKTLKAPFDLVFIDADKPNYIGYYEAALPKLTKGGLIVADNVLWGGEALLPKTEQGRAIARFNEHVRKDKRVAPVMLTVRDGMTLAVKI
jgi:caffeoyl-CoA O-methyltransferase